MLTLEAHDRQLFVDREKPLFEAWAKAEDYNLSTYKDLNPQYPDTYISDCTREAFFGWLARASFEGAWK